MIVSFVKNGDVVVVRKVFLYMLFKDVVLWNFIIGGFVKNFLIEEVLKFFKDMCFLNIELDDFIFFFVIIACVRVGFFDYVLWVYDFMIGNKIVLNDILFVVFIGMYVKCGKIEMVKEVFGSIRSRDVFVWNVMIIGLVIYGFVFDVILLFK